MKIGDDHFSLLCNIGASVNVAANNPIDSNLDLLEMHKRHKEAMVSEHKDEAMQKVEEAKQSNAQATFKMMDRHHEIVKKSQELLKKQAQKRTIERLAQKHREEQSEILAEMAIRNAERRDLLEATRLKS